MLVVAVALPGGATDPPAVTLGVAPPNSDLLYVQPIEGITPRALADALARLGFALDGPARAAGVRVHVDAEGRADALARRLAATGLVRSVEADGLVHATQSPATAPEATPAAPPNDPLYQDMQRAYLEAIGAPDAWAAGARGQGALIAIIDTGVDFDHVDLVPQLAVNLDDDFFDDIDNDGNGCTNDILGCSFVSLSTADPSCGYTQEPPHWFSRDDEGHGTFVAGIAAAAGSNEVGVTGVAPEARILPVKVLDCTATGRISDAAAGIRYAADSGADVINISFGTPNDSPALRDAVEYAQASGAIVVASAGNDGSRGITYPAAYLGVIAVAASGATEGTAESGPVDYQRTAPFARFGLGIDFLAPGVDLVSTFPEPLCASTQWNCLAGGYATATGSSFATPVVSGAVALMLSAHPQRSNEFNLALLRNARREALIGEIGRLLNVGAAVEREIFQAGLPGASRTSEGDPPGPAAP